LNIFGDNLENYFGHFKFLIFYFAAGLGAAFLQILVNPLSEIPMMGASGAIAGVMGAYLLLFPKNPIVFYFFWLCFYTELLFLRGQCFFIGFSFS